jgi:putative transcription antitermination factor YqgF
VTGRRTRPHADNAGRCSESISRKTSASPCPTRRGARDDTITAATIEKTCGEGRAQHEATVIGLPRALSGKLGEAAQSALVDAEALRVLTRDLGIEVDTYDERFTTMIAQQGLTQAHPRKQRRQKAKREQVDAAAATVLLQSWLDARAAGA